jgi:hypothetical protein
MIEPQWIIQFKPYSTAELTVNFAVDERDLESFCRVLRNHNIGYEIYPMVEPECLMK